MIIQSGNPKMNHQNNSLKPRTPHNGDAAYYVLDYLAHSFPVQLYEPFTDSEGNLSSRPVVRDGQPVECREAARRRDALIEKEVGDHPADPECGQREPRGARKD
jgi:hypothetical protein